MPKPPHITTYKIIACKKCLNYMSTYIENTQTWLCRQLKPESIRESTYRCTYTCMYMYRHATAYTACTYGTTTVKVIIKAPILNPKPRPTRFQGARPIVPSSGRSVVERPLPPLRGLSIQRV